MLRDGDGADARRQDENRNGAGKLHDEDVEKGMRFGIEKVCVTPSVWDLGNCVKIALT